jgi:hypothetical protein
VDPNKLISRSAGHTELETEQVKSLPEMLRCISSETSDGDIVGVVLDPL